MSRNPSSSSSGSGRSASHKSGSSAGTSAGTSAGSRMGAGISTPPPTPRISRAPLGVTPIGTPTDERPKARPMLLILAGVGWFTFAVEWLVILVVIMQMGSRPNPAVATPPLAVAPPAPTAPAVTTSAPVPAPAATPPAPRPVTSPVAPTPAPVAPAPTAPVTSSNNAPNILSIALPAGQTAVLLDAIDNTSPYLADAKAALVKGLTLAPAGNQSFRLIAIRDGKPVEMSSAALNPGPSQQTPLNNFLSPLTPLGKGGLSAGIDAAIATKPANIVFITARSTGWASYVSTLENKLKAGNPRITLHVVQVGDPSPELRAFVTGSNGGTYLQLTPAQVKALPR